MGNDCKGSLLSYSIYPKAMWSFFQYNSCITSFGGCEYYLTFSHLLTTNQTTICAPFNRYAVSKYLYFASLRFVARYFRIQKCRKLSARKYPLPQKNDKYYWIHRLCFLPIHQQQNTQHTIYVLLHRVLLILLPLLFFCKKKD